MIMEEDFKNVDRKKLTSNQFFIWIDETHCVMFSNR